MLFSPTIHPLQTACWKAGLSVIQDLKEMYIHEKAKINVQFK